jgi:hypothetical protein
MRDSMEYKDILNAEKEKLDSSIRWWPYYFYHYTDVHNIVGILRDGIILSRKDAMAGGKMLLDNASASVIDHTDKDTFNYARLYFRPYTPTQFNNEGYKPYGLRRMELNANCAVPVFIVLDSLSVLQMEGVFFVEKGLAGHGHNKTFGKTAFSELEFDKIYHHGWIDKSKQNDIKEYRSSEVIRESGFPITDCLKQIICRSDSERETLLYILRTEAPEAYIKYKKYVSYRPELDCFYNNGIFVREVNMNGGYLCIDFNDPSERIRGTAEIDVRISAIYKDVSGSMIHESNEDRKVYFHNAGGVVIPMDFIPGTNSAEIRISFDGSEMYRNAIWMTDFIVVE